MSRAGVHHFGSLVICGKAPSWNKVRRAAHRRESGQSKTRKPRDSQEEHITIYGGGVQLESACNISVFCIYTYLK